MFCGICKFTQFWNCAAQIRNYVVANQVRNGNPNFELAQLDFEIARRNLKFRYRQRRKYVQEAQASIVSDSVWKRLAKNAIPSKTILKDKGQKIMRLLKINTVAHCSSSGWNAFQLTSWRCVRSCKISKMHESGSTISKLVSNYAIYNLCSTSLRLRETCVLMSVICCDSESVQSVVMLFVPCDSQAELMGWDMLLSAQLHLLHSISTFLHAGHTAVLLCQALGCRGDNHLGGFSSVSGRELGVSCLLIKLFLSLWL